MKANTMKYTISWVLCILLSVLFIFTVVGCSHKDPEAKIINEQYTLVTKDGEVALYKINENDSDEIIFCKNFVAYTAIDNLLVLCEELDDSTQVFWKFDLEIGSYDRYDTYSSLLSDLSLDKLNWTRLWVKEFSVNA